MALQRRFAERGGFAVQMMYTDDGIVLRLADAEELPPVDLLFPAPEEVEELVTAQLADTALFAGLFRENAARALLLPRRRPDRRRPLWAQRQKAQQLLAAVRRYPDFPVVLETYRQALSDLFDLPALKALLRQVRRRQVEVTAVETPTASPFARSLVFAWVAAFLYEGDAPLAERKAQALTLDRRLLGELLGQPELRELLDPEAVAEVEAELQHLAADRRAVDLDELHDLLRRLGDLTETELAARCTGDPRPWLTELQRQRRAAEIAVAGERRWIAAEDAGRYRDALGVRLPTGLPDSFLEPAEHPLEDLLRRFARHHGPFLGGQAAARFGLRPALVESALRAAEREGVLVRGEIRPGGAEPDWCDAEVLRRLRRRTLARLRREAEAVDAAALARFLPAWQGIGGNRGGSERLLDAVAQLEGLPLPWSLLATVLLPQRVSGFTVDQLDLLAAAGRIVWVGQGRLGKRDGRIVLYRREQAARLLPPEPAEAPTGALAAAILTHLEQRGASFLVELETAVRGACPGATGADFRAALWELVWAGLVTNDTFAPLRALGRPLPRTARGRQRAGQPLAGGRWSLVRHLRDPRLGETERALARAEMLLERYGIVSREAAQSEELARRVRPVVQGPAGDGGGRPGAPRLLRRRTRRRPVRPTGRHRLAAGVPPAGGVWDGEVQILAALDPANPFGALLPWPAAGGGEGSRPRRVAGAWVVLVAGRPVLYLAPGGRQLTTFPAGTDEAALAAACRALRRLPRGGWRGLLTIEKINGVPVRESPWLGILRECGFERDYRGLVAKVASPGEWRGRRAWATASTVCPRRPGINHLHPESTAAARRLLNPGAAAVMGGGLAHDGQADTAADPRPAGGTAEKRLENLLAFRSRNARSMVTDEIAHCFPLALAADLYVACPSGIMDGVVDQVGEDLHRAGSPAPRPGGVGRGE